MDKLDRALQEGLLTVLVHKEEGKTIAERVKASLFESDYRDIAEKAIAYWNKYGKPPRDDLPNLVADVLEDRENKKSSSYRRILVSLIETKDTISAEHTLDSINKFIKRQEIKLNVMGSFEKLDAKKEDRDYDAEDVEQIWFDHLTKRLGSDLLDDPDTSLLDDRRGNLPDFPLDYILAKKLQKIIKRAARGTGTTVAHVAVPMFGIASSLVGMKRKVQASKGFIEPLTMWTALVGFSGTGKTPGINATKKPLDAIAEDREQEIAYLRREHEQKRLAAQSAKKKWENECKRMADRGHKPHGNRRLRTIPVSS
jgi:hypothetical protein